MLCQYISQAASCEVGHDQVGKSILLTVFVDGNNIDVLKFGYEIGFTPEAAKEVIVCSIINHSPWVEDLDRYLT